MNNCIAIAGQLREVQEAHEDFLMRAWMDQFVIGPMLLDRLADDLAAMGPHANINGLPLQTRLRKDDN